MDPNSVLFSVNRAQKNPAFLEEAGREYIFLGFGEAVGLLTAKLRQEDRNTVQLEIVLT